MLLPFAYYNDGNTFCKSTSEFTMHISGNNVLPSEFAGSEVGTTVRPCGVSETIPNPGIGRSLTGYSRDHSGTIFPGETKKCTATNTFR